MWTEALAGQKDLCFLDWQRDLGAELHRDLGSNLPRDSEVGGGESEILVGCLVA